MRASHYLRFRSIFAGWALLFSFANAISHIPVEDSRDVWFGWPFVYYGNETRFSTELTIYAWPLLLNLMIHLAIASLIIAPIYYRVVPEWLKRHVFNFSIVAFVIVAFFYWAFCVDLSWSLGPRHRLEPSLFNRFVIGPRHVLNPIA